MIYRHIQCICTILLCGCITFTSCDTRDDYFKMHSDPPVISLHYKNDSTSDGKGYITVDLSWGKTVEIDFDFDTPDDEITDLIVINHPNINNRYDYYYFKDISTTIEINEDSSIWVVEGVNGAIYDMYQFDNHLQFNFDKERKKIIISETTKSAKEYYRGTARSMIYRLESDSLIISSRVELKIANKLGVYGSTNIFLNLYANRPPVAKYTKVAIPDHPDHYEIITNCIDPDGDEIDYYEYCIGSPIFFKSGYDNQIGEGASSGTYITSTKLDRIKHSFIEYSSSNSIGVRCRDTWGAWSEWTVNQSN